MILNLKELNQWVTIAILKWSHPYLYPINETQQFHGIYWFTWCLFFYTNTCLHAFPRDLHQHHFFSPKIMKPIYCHLLGMGQISSGYLDDSFHQECLSNIHETITTLENAGFSPHETKSVTVPTQVLEHLGFILNSVTMSVSISNDKVAKLVKVSKSILDKTEIRIRLVAKLVGIMVSYCPRKQSGNFERYMQLSSKAKFDIKWRMNNICFFINETIDHGNTTTVLSTDASTLGWCFFWWWLPSEQAYHINYLEPKAVKLGLSNWAFSNPDHRYPVTIPPGTQQQCSISLVHCLQHRK